MQTLEHILYQLHLAYLQARKNKRNTYNQVAFEINQEKNLYDLAQQIINRTYQPKPSIAFIVKKPVTREVFAADFRDRVVHHLIYNSIYKLIDNHFIYDTYSCRKGKGTHFGINRVIHFLRSATDNYQNDAYILKLDIKSYFMNMQLGIIYAKINNLLSNKYNEKVLDFETLDYLLQKTIFINVKNNCRIKGKKSDWESLPNDKSLFNKPDGIGLPIGNLTSQVFGNIYLNEIDHYIKNELGIKYYGRYVDDMIFVHQSKDKLLDVINPLNNKLKEIGMKIHPQKIYLQHYTKGVLFIGQYIKPYRSYISNRTKNNFYRLINEIDNDIHKTEAIPWETMKDIQSRLNSYLGILQHTNSFRLKRKILEKLNHQRFLQFFSFAPDMSKVIINNDFWLWHYSQTCLFSNKATTYY